MTESIKNQVNVHSRLTVVSSTPTDPVGHICALSPIDHIMGSHTVHIIYYYRTSPFSKQHRFSMDLDNVRISLSDLLSKYPRMTGRLVRDDVHGKWEVKYNDAGIRMFKASVGITVDEWLRSANESDERSLTVWEDMPDGDPTSWSPFQIQVSEFVGGGLAIGISFAHLLADPTSAILFFKSWTDAERGDAAGHHPPILSLPQLDNHPPPVTTENPSITIKYLQKNSKLAPTNYGSTKMATTSFKFSNTTIKQGLLKLADNSTPFEYLTALFWLQIIKLKSQQMADSITHCITLCVDARKLLDVPLPMKFFGNALHFSQLCLQNKVLMGDDGLKEAAESVHSHVSGIKKDDMFSMIDWLESSRERLDGVYPKAVQMYGPELTCVNFEHLMNSKDEFESLVYEAKFRNNDKPVHMSCHVGKAEGAGLIIVGPSPEGGFSRIVTVTLPVVEIEKLCEDPVIMEMAPTMYPSGRRLKLIEHDL